MLSDADEARIVDYLLGELPDEDRTRLEEQFLRDVEYRELIRAVEDDLIDDYVRDELAPRQRELFEKHFTSPHRRQKVELARALSHRLSERPRVKESTRWSFLRAPNWAFRYALPAAAALLLAVAVWFTTGRTPPTQPGQSQADQQAQSGTPARPGERQGQSEPDPQTSPSQLAIATFVLPRGLTRQTVESTTFVVPPGTERVRLQLTLEAGDDYPAYRAQLRTARGDTSWQSGRVQSETGPAGQSVVLELPADVLRSEKYELTLTGLNKDIAEDIGYYYFGIVKK